MRAFPVIMLLLLGATDLAFAQDCRALRLACEMKDVLGEEGQGNCRRYREECQRPSRGESCAELRAACLRKDELGERGEGNCRRYRDMCRGRY
jgi:hypothetical protein